MSEKLVWDQTGERLFENGVSNLALYVADASGSYGTGVAWNGVASINEEPSGAEPTAIYANNKKYLELISAEELGLTIEAYTYPDEFEACDGSASLVPGVTLGQQARRGFAIAYKSQLGSDTNPDLGYKLHIVYGCKAGPSGKSRTTINESPEAMLMSWTVTTTPVEVGGNFRPTSKFTIDSTTANAAQLSQLEDMLFGTETAAAKMPTPAELLGIFQEQAPQG